MNWRTRILPHIFTLIMFSQHHDNSKMNLAEVFLPGIPSVVLDVCIIDAFIP